MKIAFLGLGKMGSAIAQVLLHSGENLTVWNRSRGKADPLAAAGAQVAADPGNAVEHAEAVFSMLNDDSAVESLVLGNQQQAGILHALKPGAIHISLSTISVQLCKRLAAEHTRAGSSFVAAPVFGRPDVAAQGKLWIVAGGADASIAALRPLLEKISRGTTVVSPEPWRANALKIGGNFLITAMIESLSEAMVFADANGIDPAVFLETVNSALFRSPFYEAYGKVMLSPPDEPGATIALGAKDMGLFRDAAAEAGIAAPLAEHFAADLARAAEAGLKDRDWAAGLYQLAQSAKAGTK